ncbi:MAG: cytidine deaminase [Candidatus Marinimicrobia bacterium]|jgi:cytidine deaminase|nr:cytidine deaminase [Candidatus Neomarinimicrobiota bacterium]MDP6593452.1 cytidine deaminase [Candidatus Neomarinimicrobiota bacterium]MDP6836515.1 cytidine deaminase [Candidatus Neomarinimicrobiota bacterium]MDP6966635.1 cytidine deaminase [Candidatus Neomarinimicrobiota bacterium]|tara:strand:+ start:6287 stop:6670 length:384 start_codon:yes stop_codon:yes gene_type:complete
MNPLIEAAIKVRENAYAPYSDYTVGAAVETDDGTIITGCNVESSSYGLTNCAERVALGAAIARGFKSFKAMAIAGKSSAGPCGACRQVIWDLCGDITITMIDEAGNETVHTSGDLLPYPFDDSHLKQ